MKNTKKVVALALALSVSSQAIPSYAEGGVVDTSVNESVDTSAPIANDELMAIIDEENGEVSISQNCIYDLESGIDEESVKAYVYEEGSKDKGEAIEMTGTSFSDFSVKAEIPETEGNLVVEVHASDLAGNESVVSKTTINKDSVESDGVYSNYFFQPENGYFDTKKITINPKMPFVIGADFTDADNDMSDVNVIVNTDANNCSNGVLFTGSFNSDGESKGDGTGVVSVKKVDFENYGYKYTRANMTMDFSGAKHGSSYYIWVNAGSGEYSRIEPPIVMDSKAPESSKEVDLTLSSDNMLLVAIDGVYDEGSNLKDVYALLKNEDLSEPVRVLMYPNGDSLTTKLYGGSIDLKTLDVSKGEFTVEVYAVDNCHNEGMVSSGKILKDVKIESEETVDMSGAQNQVGGTSWFKYNGTIDLSVLSESKGKVYNGAQVIINEDSSDPYNKVVSEFKLGSKEDLTNIKDNEYIEFVGGNYNIYKPKKKSNIYSNELLAQLKLKDRAYNKKLSVWVRFYTDGGITSEFAQAQDIIATDYTLPTIKVSEVSNDYYIKAEDKESGIKYVEVYDRDGLLITEDYSEASGLYVSKDKNPSTITVVDCVNNKIVYDVINKKIIEAASTQGLPSAPTGPDKYINLNEKPNTEKPENNKPNTEKPENNKPNTEKPENNKPNDDKPTEDNGGDQGGQDKPDTDKPNNDGNGDKPDSDNNDKPNTEKPNTDKPDSDNNNGAVGDNDSTDGNDGDATDKPNTDKPNNDGDKPNTEKPDSDGNVGDEIEKPNTDKPDSDGNDNGSDDSNDGSDNDSNGDSGNDSDADSDNDSDDSNDSTNKPSTDGNGDSADKPSDKPNTDSNNGGTNSGSSNDGVVSKPQDGQAGSNGNTNNGSNSNTNNGSNNNTTTTKPTLPQTGGTSSILVGAIGAITSAVGYVLARKRK